MGTKYVRHVKGRLVSATYVMDTRQWEEANSGCGVMGTY